MTSLRRKLAQVEAEVEVAKRKADLGRESALELRRKSRRQAAAVKAKNKN